MLGLVVATKSGNADVGHGFVPLIYDRLKEAGSDPEICVSFTRKTYSEGTVCKTVARLMFVVLAFSSRKITRDCVLDQPALLTPYQAKFVV